MKRETYKIWVSVEKCVTDDVDNTEEFENLEEIQRTGGTYDTLDEAINKVNEIGDEYGGDFTISDDDIDYFIEDFCPKVEPNEKSSFVEMMMDDHDCIEYNGSQYYIPQNSMLWNDCQNRIHDRLIKLYLVT